MLQRAVLRLLTKSVVRLVVNLEEKEWQPVEEPQQPERRVVDARLPLADARLVVNRVQSVVEQPAARLLVVSLAVAGRRPVVAVQPVGNLQPVVAAPAARRPPVGNHDAQSARLLAASEGQPVVSLRPAVAAPAASQHHADAVQPAAARLLAANLADARLHAARLHAASLVSVP